MDGVHIEVPGLLAYSPSRGVGSEMNDKLTHECLEDRHCIDCRCQCCVGCTVTVTLPDGREFSQCGRCADAEEADREEMP